MKKIDSSFFDSSAWIAYFFEASIRAKEILEHESIIYSSVLSIYEIKKKLIALKTSTPKIKEVFDFIQSRSIIILLDQAISEQAVDYSLHYKLGAIDALIYASAKSVNSVLLTADSDFNGLPDADILR